ncbi:hypothetical protein [Georgenia muralis]
MAVPSAPVPPTEETAHAGLDLTSPALAAVAGPRLRDQWPARRLLVAAVAAPALAVVLVVAGGGWGGPPAWSALVLAAAVLAAGTLASYVPLTGAGTVVDTGCSTCAALAAVGVVGAVVTLANNPAHAVPGAMFAVSFAAFGLTQRLVGQTSCPTA